MSDMPKYLAVHKSEDEWSHYICRSGAGGNDETTYIALTEHHADIAELKEAHKAEWISVNAPPVEGGYANAETIGSAFGYKAKTYTEQEVQYLLQRQCEACANVYYQLTDADTWQQNTIKQAILDAKIED